MNSVFLLVAIAAGRRLAHRLFNGEKDLKLDYEILPPLCSVIPLLEQLG